jgi:hypothetical protein
MSAVRQEARICTVYTTHLAEFLVVVSLAKEVLKRLFAPLNSGPRQRRIPLGVRIRVPHVSALYEPFHKEEIILYQMRNKGFSVRGNELWHWTRKRGRGVGLTLDGFPQADRCISFSHPRLDSGAGQTNGRGGEREGRTWGREKKAGDNGGNIVCLLFQISICPLVSRGRHAVTGSPPFAAGSRSLPVNRVTAQPSICFFLLLTLASQVRCQKSFHELLCPLHKTVRTSSRPSSPPSLTPVHLSPIYSLLGRKLPRLL